MHPILTAHAMRPMHQRLALAAACAALLCPAAALAAQPERFYLGVHGGVNNLDDWPATVNFGPVAPAGGLELDKGAHYGVQAGTRTENARFELEWQRGRAKIAAVSVGAVRQAASGTATYDAFTVNAYRTFAFTPQLAGFAGGGLGWGRSHLPALGTVAGCNCFRDTHEQAFAWQLRGGAEYEIKPGHRLTAQYTALRIPGAPAVSTPGASYGRRTVGAVSVGYLAAF
jgi:opacity protein-like surface antigen